MFTMKNLQLEKAYFQRWPSLRAEWEALSVSREGTQKQVCHKGSESQAAVCGDLQGIQRSLLVSLLFFPSCVAYTHIHIIYLVRFYHKGKGTERREGRRKRRRGNVRF